MALRERPHPKARHGRCDAVKDNVRGSFRPRARRGKAGLDSGVENQAVIQRLMATRHGM